VKSVGQENFEWVVDHAAKMAVERALQQKPGGDNLTWGRFVTNSAAAFLGGGKESCPETKEEKKANLNQGKSSPQK